MIAVKTLEELTDQFKQNYATELGVNVSDLGDSIIVECKVMAAMLYSLHLKANKIQNNVYPDLADEETLKRYGLAILNRYPSLATQGIYELSVTGTGTIGVDTQFVGNDDIKAAGYIYTNDLETTITGTGTILLRSLDAGVESRLYIGDKLTAVQPLSGITSEVVVTSIDTYPTAAETIEEYRSDVMNGIRLLSQGGSSADYILWCLEIPEVRAIYPYTLGQAGDLNIYVECTPDNTEIGEVDGYPTQATLDKVYKVDGGIETGSLVYDTLKQRGRKPMGVMNINVLPINTVAIDIIFTGLSNTSILDEIKTSISEMLYYKRPFISGAYPEIYNNSIISNSDIATIIDNVKYGKNIYYTSFIWKANNNTVTEYELINGTIPYINTVTNA